MLRLAFVLAAVFVIAACQQVVPRTWELPQGSRSVITNGYETTYVEKGSGTPVLLVHGTFSDYRSWSAQFEPFASRHRVLCPSLRHHYPEPWKGDGDSFTIRQHARDLAEMIERLGAAPAHIVAHSRGGDVALRLAHMRPDLVRSLVLAEPAPIMALIPDSTVAREAVQTRRTQVSRTLDKLQAGNVDGALETFIDINVAPGAWSKMAPAAKEGLRQNAWTMKHLMQDLEEPLTCEDVAAIKAPVLMLLGDKSPPIFGEMQKGLRKCLPRATQLVIPGASHAMARTHTAAFNAAVLEFIARN